MGIQTYRIAAPILMIPWMSILVRLLQLDKRDNRINQGAAAYSFYFMTTAPLYLYCVEILGMGIACLGLPRSYTFGIQSEPIVTRCDAGPWIGQSDREACYTCKSYLRFIDYKDGKFHFDELESDWVEHGGVCAFLFVVMLGGCAYIRWNLGRLDKAESAERVLENPVRAEDEQWGLNGAGKPRAPGDKTDERLRGNEAR
ncbi:uncharacterized protein LTR77_000061 [Saxophila tyrrhenica]|uniref:Uncharacterized protein n=1 Tax=Saxophila tyrrhenica TaxID=1690608 RepID=A0AAV9PQ66_9PEZI|nr:hypothetical protein LTR77_000061 [Saxophila tyrrhenica]